MPGTTCTSSQPSSPKLSRICLVACTRSGAVMYSHFVMLATLVGGRDPGRRVATVTRVNSVDPDDVMTRPAEPPDAVVRYAAHEAGLIDVHLPADVASPRPLVVFVHG